MSDICRQLQAALARFGSAAPLQVEGTRVRMTPDAPAHDLKPLALRWEDLGAEEQQREVTILARRLTRVGRGSGASAPTHGRAALWPLVWAALAVGGAVVYWRSPYGPGGNRGLDVGAPDGSAGTLDSPPAVAESDEEREARLCRATRARVLRGATVSPLDVDGWVVEIDLARPTDERGWSRLGEFVSEAPAAIIWKGAPQLVAQGGENAGLQVHRESLAGRPEALERLSLTLSGSYVKPYFQENQRIEVVRLAQALAKSHGARHGGVYARCAAGRTHHLGSWFMGTTVPEAAASLLYFMGATAVPAHLPPGLLSGNPELPVEPAYALRSLSLAGESLDRSTLSHHLGPQDGAVAAKPGFASVHFPFVDSNRALRASRGLAAALELSGAP